MTDKARELLERVLAGLAQPEVKREALSDEEIDTELSRLNTHYYRSFEAGVRFAEKHHGIGGGDE